jgi:hypothetical protein
MSQQISLKEAERNAFRSQYNDGLWDIFLGCFFLIFIVALYLSPSLGDFWSSVAMLPLWGLVFLAFFLTRRFIVTPRIGKVKFGPVRMKKLTNFTITMLVVNIAAFILGAVAAANFVRVSGSVVSVIFGFVFLAGFSLAAYFLEFNRLFVYGLMLGISPLVGEWLWANGYAAHHGWPVTFGTISGIMILVGLVLFIHLLRGNPVPDNDFPSEKA